MGGSDQLKTDALMDQMKAHMATDAGKDLTKKMGLIYEIHVSPKKIGVDEVVYTVDLKKGEVKKGVYKDGKPDAIFTSKDDDFYKIATGGMNPQMAFMRGALKIKGSIGAAQNLHVNLPKAIQDRIGDVTLREQLSNTDTLNEVHIDNAVNSFIEQVKDGSWESGGWPQTFTNYSVSKLVVNCYTRMVARKVSNRPEGHKIYIKCYCPGWVKTAIKITPNDA